MLKCIKIIRPIVVIGLFVYLMLNIQVYDGWAYVLHNMDGRGNWAYNVEVYYGGTVGLILTPPAPAGYRFKMWDTYNSGDIYREHGDIYNYPVWEPLSYIMYFDYQGATGGDWTPSITRDTAMSLGVLPMPVKTGYVFDGWHLGVGGAGEWVHMNTVWFWASNVTVYAHWVALDSTVTFNGDGATYLGESSRVVTNGNAVGGLPVPLKTGFSFNGWYTGVNGTGTKYESTTVSYTDVTLYAYWIVNNYTINFDYQLATSGNTEINRVRVYGSALGALPAPSRTGHSFNGWYIGANGTGVKYEAASICYGNVNLYASWTPHTYQINFDYQGATGNNTTYSKLVNYAAGVGVLPNPTRIGHTFNGWFTGVNGTGVQYTDGTTYTNLANMSLYAKWTVNNYTIFFDFQSDTGGAAPISKIVTYGQVVGILPAPIRTGYTFGGWFTSPNGAGSNYVESTGYTLASNLTLYAKWVPNKYTLSFNYQTATGGTAPASKEVTFGQEIGVMSAPTLRGHTFKGWFTATNGAGTNYISSSVYNIANNTTFYAYLTPNTYKLNFDYQSATSGDIVDYKDVTFGQAINTLPEPVRVGYTFRGWFTGTDGEGDAYLESTVYDNVDNIDLYAYWTPNTYKIIFDYNNATGEASVLDKDVIYDSVVGELPNPTRIGYTFDGWQYGVIDYTEETIYKIADAITLTAQWVPNVYRISFDYQESIGSSRVFENLVQDKAVTFDALVGELPEPKRTGYTFVGWNFDLDGQGQIYLSDTVYKVPDDSILYAIWEANTYTISFVYQGADSDYSVESIQVIYDLAVGELPAPSRTGYTFNGWHNQYNTLRLGNLDVDSASTEVTSETVYQKDSDLVLYAAWGANHYNLIFGYEDADALDVFRKEVVFDSAIGELPTPVRKGYRFSGWYTSQEGKGNVYNARTVYKVPDDLILYAYWSTTGGPRIILDYQDTVDGQDVSKKELIYGKFGEALPTPERPGYAFKGWYTGYGGQGDLITSDTVHLLDDGTILYASWQGYDFNLLFDYQGADSGIGVIYKSVTASKIIGELPLPSKTGRVFGGWYDGVAGQGRKYISASLYDKVEDITLYAYWVGIIFDYQDGSGDEASVPKLVPRDKPIGKDVTPGGPIGKLPKPSRPGYILDGWNTKQDGSGKFYDEDTIYYPEDDDTLYAIWTPEKYNLYFDYQGASENIGLVLKEVTYEQPVGDLYLPVRSGYIFNGWFTLSNGKGIQYTRDTVYRELEDITLYALWGLVNGSGILEGSSVEDNGSDDNDNLGDNSGNAPGSSLGSDSGSNSGSNSGNNLDNNLGNVSGGNSGNDLGNASVGVSGNNSENGLGNDSGHTPARSLGVSFENKQGEVNLDELELSSEQVKENGVVHTIIFDYQGADGGDTLKRKVIVDDNVGILPHPTKSGYGFGGWYLKPKGEGGWYPTGRLLNNQSIVLYAFWRPNVIQHIFHYQGGSIDGFVTGKDVLYDVSVGILPDTKRAGYKFIGWFTQPEGKGTVYTEETVVTSVEPVHLYAFWIRV